MSSNTKKSRTWVWIAVIVLLVLHQDFWFWDTHKPLVFGFMPIGLAYHAGISILASVVWFFATADGFGDEEVGVSTAADEGKATEQ